MLIATWNVNSIRTRLTQVIDWMNQVNPDILCLQETKVIDSHFPGEAFEKLGYSVEVYGQKSYNGVAIISKIKTKNIQKGFNEDLSHNYDVKNFIDDQIKKNESYKKEIKKYYLQDENKQKLKEDLSNQKLYENLENYFINKINESSTDKLRKK